MRVNRWIRAAEVRVVDEEGKQLGLMPTRQALDLAKERGLDLVEVAATAQPPVCRILDYGRFKYEQAKKERQAKKGQHLSQVREVKVRPKIGEHDLQAKLRNARKLLQQGDKIKVIVVFRGREMAHQDRGWKLLQRVGESLKDVAALDRPPAMEGNTLGVIFSPSKQLREAQKKEREAKERTAVSTEKAGVAV
ncbi:MAG: translation initiation factor IF-3 [Chloroflexota bacterium]